MSKLLDMYTFLKKEDSKTLYLFKVGLFYNFLNNDAITVSNLTNLKITNLSPTILKCGFPLNSLDKYINLFNSLNLKIKIIDTANYNTAYNINDFKLSTEFKNLCKKISDIDTDFLSVQEAYSLLEELKIDVKKIEHNRIKAPLQLLNNKAFNNWDAFLLLFIYLYHIYLNLLAFEVNIPLHFYFSHLSPNFSFQSIQNHCFHKILLI